MIRILMADDHGIVREGLKQLFNLVPDIEVVGEATNGDQVLEAASRGGFDVLLLDMSMPGVSGIDLVKALRALAPKLPILVLSMHNEPPIVRRALAAGANGYISKDTSDPARLLAAIRAVSAGGRYLDPDMAERLAFEKNGDGEPLHEQLSSREHEIFRLLAQGMGVNEIGRLLCISNKTVSTHKARLMEKMNLKTNAELVRYALTNGLVD
ncbi:MAG: response regulator [Ignavibacteria bacterium]